MKNEMLNIIDENGNIVGEDTRENIHKNGLLHREVDIYFYTPKKEIIFQHRSKSKDTFPDMLGTTVGGHVEIGDDYITSAIKEIKEETGLSVDVNELKVLEFKKNTLFDDKTGRINNYLKTVYTYCYTNRIDDLTVEEGKSEGFEVWSINKLINLSEEEKKLFLPSVLNKDRLDKIINLINNK